MKMLKKWGIILIIFGLVLYLAGVIFGLFNEWLSVGGLGIILVGESPLAIILLAFSGSCILNATTVFLVSHTLSKEIN